MNANTQTQDETSEPGDQGVNEHPGFDPKNFHIKRIPGGAPHPLGHRGARFMFDGHAYEVYETKKRNRMMVRLLGQVVYIEPPPEVLEDVVESEKDDSLAAVEPDHDGDPVVAHPEEVDPLAGIGTTHTGVIANG